MPAIYIEIPGPPGHKRRHRTTRSGIAYSDPKTREFEAILRDFGHRAMDGRPLIEGPVSVAVRALYAIPQSWSKKKRQRAAEGREFPGRPDVDNILKVIDGLNGIVWKDDRQVVSAWVGKFYTAEAPCLEITVEALTA